MTGSHRGQFVLTRDTDLLPGEGPGPRWDQRAAGGWTLATCDLPVVALRGAAGQELGWLVGHAVDRAGLVRSDVHLTAVGPAVDQAGLDDLLEGLAGRFLVVLHGPVAPLVVLDSYGSLAAVHVPGRGVASVPALLGCRWDADLAHAAGFPERTTWQPFGRTLYPGARRVQADHVLDLATGDSRRSWVPPEPDGSADTGAAAAEVLAHLRHVITSVSAHHPLVVPLTAGRDSRVLLAACGPLRSSVSAFTLVHPGRRSVDRAVAVRLAGRAGVPLELLSVGDGAGAAGPDEWLHATGHALGGELWRSQSALAGLDPAAVLLPGTAGEVGRAHMLRPGDDLQDGTVTPELLLRRLRTPAQGTALQDAADWLDRLPPLSFVATLELAYIEQRLACWAGPGHYGNRRSAFEVSPFSGRALFRRLLSLPVGYRRREGLTDDLLAQAWPDAPSLPFNEFPGLEGTARRVVRRARSAVRSARGAA